MKRIKLYPLIFILLITLTTQTLYAADARYTELAEKLSEVGVFKGSDEGFNLERQPTRLEGLIMLIRLLGKEDDALALSQEPCHFNDVPDWGRGYVNYAYNNGLTTGISATAFGSMQLMDAKSYMTFLLRALGYNDKEGDFSWSTSIDYGKTIGLINENQWFELGSQTLLRDHVAKLSYDVLSMPLKDSDTSLLEDLVDIGAIDADTASALNEDSPSTPSPVHTDAKDSEVLDRAIQACVYIEVTDIFGQLSSGSGFYIDNKGTLVTNFHVIQFAKSITITQDDGTVYRGSVTVKGYDETLDLAVLKTNYTSNHYLIQADSDDVLRSQTVYAIGSPLGLQNTISEGLISRIFSDDTNNKHFQISNAISPGSSGGALINSDGQVIGVTDAGYTSGENLGLAIPINHLDRLAHNGSYTFSDLFDQDYVNNYFDTLVINDDNHTTLLWPNMSADDYLIEMSVNNGPFENIWGVDLELIYIEEYDTYAITLDNLMEDRTYRFKVTAYYDDSSVTYTTQSEAVAGTGTLYNPTDLINDLYALDFTLGGIHIDGIDPSIGNSGDIFINLYLDKANTIAFVNMNDYQKEQFFRKLTILLHTLDEGMDGSTYWLDIYSVNYTDSKPIYLDDLVTPDSMFEPIYTEQDNGTWYGELNVAWGWMDVDDTDSYLQFNDNSTVDISR